MVCRGKILAGDFCLLVSCALTGHSLRIKRSVLLFVAAGDPMALIRLTLRNTHRIAQRHQVRHNRPRL